MTDINYWTIAYRKPRANRFQRATDLATDWQDAMDIAKRVSTANPELQVYVITTAEAEHAGFTCTEDIGNILVDSGKRVRVFDTGSLASLTPDEIVARNAGEAIILSARTSDSEPAYIRSARIGAHGNACVCGQIIRYEGRDIACHVAR